jgi:protein-S-isoprenylcysteine O-methyltransferase Ste14
VAALAVVLTFAACSKDASDNEPRQVVFETAQSIGEPWMFIMIGVVVVGLAAAGLVYFVRTHRTGGSDGEILGGCGAGGIIRESSGHRADTCAHM